jgi:hypothetical protein
LGGDAIDPSLLLLIAIGPDELALPLEIVAPFGRETCGWINPGGEIILRCFQNEEGQAGAGNAVTSTEGDIVFPQEGAVRSTSRSDASKAPVPSNAVPSCGGLRSSSRVAPLAASCTVSGPPSGALARISHCPGAVSRGTKGGPAVAVMQRDHPGKGCCQPVDQRFDLPGHDTMGSAAMRLGDMAQPRQIGVGGGGDRIQTAAWRERDGQIERRMPVGEEQATICGTVLCHSGEAGGPAIGQGLKPGHRLFRIGGMLAVARRCCSPR